MVSVISWSCYRTGNNDSGKNNNGNVTNDFYVSGTKCLNSFNPHNDPIRWIQLCVIIVLILYTEIKVQKG